MDEPDAEPTPDLAASPAPSDPQDATASGVFTGGDADTDTGTDEPEAADATDDATDDAATAASAAEAAPERPIARWLPPEAATVFVREELLSPRRRRPVVGVTTRHRSRVPLIDIDALARQIGDVADIVVIESGRATRALTVAAPPRFDCLAGWMRLWWPGISKESRSEDHPLYALVDAAAAQRAVEEIDRQLHAVAAAPTRSTEAIVASVGNDGVVLEVDGQRFRLRREALRRQKIELARDAFRPGQQVAIKPRSLGKDGVLDAELVWRGPRRWERLFSLLAVNDVVRARVVPAPAKSPLRGLHVELLPGCVGAVPLHEIPPELQAQRDLALPGRVVLVRVADVPPAPRPLQLSMYALPSSRQPTMHCSLFAEGPLFLDDDTAPASAPPPLAAELERVGAELRVAREQLATARAERAELRLQFDLLHELHCRAERTIEQNEARIRGLDRQLGEKPKAAAAPPAPKVRIVDGTDATAVENLLTDAITRSCLARSTEDQRREQPPLPFRLGRQFVSRLRDLEGIAEAKVVDFCADVLLQVAARKPGRDVMPLGDSAAATAPRVRAEDGAKAWRCSLQSKSETARRLHWWQLPDGGIEFASIARHDDFSIPE